MFDIGGSELVVIGVVALVAIGPKELPGVLRMVGQWVGKARRMATDFQGQFNEAMREAEMADVKKAFDEVKDAASGFSKSNLLTSLTKDVSDAMSIDKGDTATPPVMPTTPEPPTPETFVEAEAHAAALEPLVVTREVQPSPVAEPVEAGSSDQPADTLPVSSAASTPAETPSPETPAEPGNPDILKNAKAL